MHIYPLFVIVAGLLSKCCGAVVNTTVYNICSGSRHNNVRVNAASSPFLIHSQGEGIENYDNNMDCSLALQSGTQPLLLSFHFRHFVLDYSCLCDLDSLCLNGILFCTHPAYRLYYILPGNQDFTVYFHTNPSVNMSGFQLFVTTSPLSEGQKVEQPAVRTKTFGWLCTVATAYYPGIPYSDGCVQYLRRGTNYSSVYTDDDNETSTTTKETSTPTTKESEYDFYYVRNSKRSPIKINTSSSPFLILSPDYGATVYFKSKNYSLVVRSGVQPLVLRMDIKDFEVDSHSNCSLDSLCMGGATFCGDWLTGYNLQFILPENSDFTISFRTDGRVHTRGFKIEVSQELATSQIVHQPRSGFVSSSGALTYTEETYRPGYPYKDRCKIRPVHT